MQQPVHGGYQCDQLECEYQVGKVEQVGYWWGNQQEYKSKYPTLKKLESSVSSFKVNTKNTDDSKFYPLAAKLLSEHIKPLTAESEEIQEVYDNLQKDIARFKNQRATGHEGEYYLQG